jgi:hypothetical protein
VKKCSNPKCIHEGKLQPLSNFHRNKINKKDGLRTQCKDCRNKKEKERNIIKMQNLEYREKINKRKREWYKNHPNYSKDRGYVKKFKKNHPNYYKNYHKEWHREKYRNDSEYREKIKRISRERYHKNKVKLVQTQVEIKHSPTQP